MTHCIELHLVFKSFGFLVIYFLIVVHYCDCGFAIDESLVGFGCGYPEQLPKIIIVSVVIINARTLGTHVEVSGLNVIVVIQVSSLPLC